MWVDDQRQKATTYNLTLNLVGPNIRSNYFPLLWVIKDIPILTCGSFQFNIYKFYVKLEHVKSIPKITQSFTIIRHMQRSNFFYLKPPTCKLDLELSTCVCLDLQLCKLYWQLHYIVEAPLSVTWAYIYANIASTVNQYYVNYKCVNANTRGIQFGKTINTSLWVHKEWYMEFSTLKSIREASYYVCKCL